MVNSTIGSWKTCTDSRTWSYCWHNLLKRCRSSIVRPSADSIRRTRARSSRLAWTVHGKTGKRRFWIIRQRWGNISHNTSSTYSSELWDTQLIYSFFEGPQSWYIQTHKITNSMQKESWKSRRQDTASFKIWRYNHSGSQSSGWRETIAIASSIFGSGAGFGYSMETELSVQKQDCTRYDDKFAAILTSRKQAWSYLHW